jgi:pyruvate/2-oxoglutarate dehydrogenase complex dihydrolipoamide dehydrogenase (E3) component
MAPQPDTDGKHTPYAYPLVPERVSERVDSQLRARGVEVILNDRVRFPNSDASTNGAANGVVKDEEAWDGREGLLPGLRTITLASGQTVQADCVFGGSGASPNSGLVSAVDPTALVGGYIAVDPNFRILSSSPTLAGVYALGDVANTGGRKTAGQRVGESRRLTVVLLAHLACEAKGVTPTAKPYVPGFLQSILVPIGEGRGGPGDGIGAGTVDLGWLGVWRAPEFLLRWFAKDYFCTQHFVARYQGEVGVKDL